ncbi:MAG: insulinase family protein [Acidobacteriia bacterium]|nr:insulinase family protein [Terriglobia bacterium]
MNVGVHKDVLPNGLTVVTEPMPSVRSVSVGIWLRTGSREEREAENGVTHFIEHMLFKGTRCRTAEEIARAADSIGGHLDAFTAKECTSFSIKVLDEHLPRAFDIVGDLLKNPLFRPEDISKERRVIQEEIKMVEDTPDDLVHEIFTQTYWRGHALGRPILGTRQSVGQFERGRLLGYFHRHYTPGNMLVAAAGHVEHARVMELTTKEFGSLPAVKPTKMSPPPVANPHIKYRKKKELEQVHICLGTPAFPQTHARRYAAYVMNSVLGGGMSSRLFQNIREKRGLAYSVFSNLSAFRDAGCLSVYAGTSKENARQVVQLIVEELCRLKESPLTAEELQHAKDYLKGNLLLSLESTMSRMSNVARQEMYFGRHITLDEIASGVDSVTSDEVQAVAREFFSTDRIALTILGPQDHLKLTRNDLAC